MQPYVSEKGGVVLNTTINKYAYASLSPREDGVINVSSLDYDVIAKYRVEESLAYDGKLDLVKAVVNVMNLHGMMRGLDLFIHSDAPPGSGLGSSSTMVVALIGAVRHWLHLEMGNYDIAEMAYRIEREELAIKGGMQNLRENGWQKACRGVTTIDEVLRVTKSD